MITLIKEICVWIWHRFRGTIKNNCKRSVGEWLSIIPRWWYVKIVRFIQAIPTIWCGGCANITAAKAPNIPEAVCRCAWFIGRSMPASSRRCSGNMPSSNGRASKSCSCYHRSSDSKFLLWKSKVSMQHVRQKGYKEIWF